MMEASNAETATRERDPDAALQQLMTLQAGTIRELRTLEPPRGDEAQVREVLLHLDRLQAAVRELATTEGEEVLAPVAAIGAGMDAVARAAERYGLFRRCGAYRVIPGIKQVIREQAAWNVLPGPGGMPPKAATAPSQALELSRLASALVPPGRTVSSRQDCTGDDRVSPLCVTIELVSVELPIASRRADIAALAARDGWTQPNPTDGKWPPGLLVLHRAADYDATVWLAASDCTPRPQLGDAPSPKPAATPCGDTIMVSATR